MKIWTEKVKEGWKVHTEDDGKKELDISAIDFVFLVESNFFPIKQNE